MAEGFPLCSSVLGPHLEKTERTVLIVLSMLSRLVCGKVALKDPRHTLVNTQSRTRAFSTLWGPVNPFTPALRRRCIKQVDVTLYFKVELLCSCPRIIISYVCNLYAKPLSPTNRESESVGAPH